ncbi:mycothione reductase [Segniliparus rugosus]|uniref:Mycothione reductase n=1 Tax=Segniliparus rugosus (strain ATCC BAA-974 / DSM 45345 / CCUG 50838 / CIP 108380 / JCM 13579 / CDC 945) TaxID=679197 RepID=E5XUZ9_SEGRC|nr:mycothione reductase [Segniliparus rugosus]EFV11835.1 mycothione reductase [Segniliparus rugosus ATCC BAA-974]
MAPLDLAIIGSGSGNSIPDERFDSWRIGIFESGVYGGTCLNVGCIPTKMFVYAADVAEIARESDRYGVHAKVESVDWPAIVRRVFGRIDPISAGGKRYRIEDCPNIEVRTSPVRFAGKAEGGAYRLATEAGEEVLAKRVVIAAGARPVVPEEVIASGAPFFTNEDVMRLPELPERLLVLGGGYIATEFAHVFSSLGSRVTVVARGDALLRYKDHEISQRFTEVAKQKWDVRLGARLERVEQVGGEIALVFQDGTRASGDVLLVATGRRPNGDRLDLGSIGLELDETGRVVTDRHGRTSAEDVWAFGDVSSPYQLKHVANHEARVVQANLLRGWDSLELDAFDHRFVPAAVFTHPQVATVGLTEAQAREQGFDVAVKTQNFGDVAYGWGMEDTTGLCKLVAERRTGRLLGAHLLGPQAATLIQPLIQALSFGLDARSMARGQYWIHPALSEVVENALLGLDL